MKETKEQFHIFSNLQENGDRRHGVEISLQEYLRLGKAGYRYIPLCYRLHADCLTPIGAYLALGRGSNSFLLESVEKGMNIGRYSLIGLEPLVVISASDARVVRQTAGETWETTGDPLAVLTRTIQELRVAPVEDSSTFYGGAVGYLAYDYVRQLEKLPGKKPDPLALPTAYWLVPRQLLVFDHVTKEILLIFLTPSGKADFYHKAQADMRLLLRKLAHTRPLPPAKAILPDEGKIISTFSREDFCRAVQRAKDYIFAGDIFQVVLSQRLSLPFTGDPFALYRVLRTVNPSPYLFYLDGDDHQVIGSSPEMLVRLVGDEAEVRPIAGTRPRFLPGRTEDSLVEELLSDEKEQAEHLMLVDLGRNDLGRICRYGTVKVEEFMAVERYSHVLHLVSRVTGKMEHEADLFSRALSLLKAVFPAGTLSGAPKVRAMEIIDVLEPCRRGIYGGAVGYIGFDGRMDTCIAIRTAVAAHGFMHLQAGAGIVADSDPEKEFQETIFKLRALFKSVTLLEKGGEGWL